MSDALKAAQALGALRRTQTASFRNEAGSHVTMTVGDVHEEDVIFRMNTLEENRTEELVFSRHEAVQLHRLLGYALYPGRETVSADGRAKIFPEAVQAE